MQSSDILEELFCITQREIFYHTYGFYYAAHKKNLAKSFITFHLKPYHANSIEDVVSERRAKSIFSLPIKSLRRIIEIRLKYFRVFCKLLPGGTEMIIQYNSPRNIFH